MFIFRTLIVCHKAWIGNFVIGGLNVHSVLYTIWTFNESSSDGFKNANQLLSWINIFNQHENDLPILPTQSQQQPNIVNGGGNDYSYDDLLNAISLMPNLREDDLNEHFLEETYN